MINLLVLLFLNYPIMIINENHKDELRIHLNICLDKTCQETDTYLIDNKHFNQEGKLFGYSLGNKKYLNATLKGNYGAMDIEITDSINRVIIYGKYSSGLDTLRGQDVEQNLMTGEIGFVVNKYFEPLKDSIWTYKAFNGKTIFELNFDTGAFLGASTEE